MSYEVDPEATGDDFTDKDIAMALGKCCGFDMLNSPATDGSLPSGVGDTQWIGSHSDHYVWAELETQGDRSLPRGWTIASLMGGVALAAVGIAALNYLRAGPVPTLATAALVASILAVIARGRVSRLNRWALVLFLTTGLSLGGGGWHRCGNCRPGTTAWPVITPG